MNQVADLRSYFDSFCEDYFQRLVKGKPIDLNDDQNTSVLPAIRYSFFSGGKRFRPLLGLTFAQQFTQDLKPFLPWLLSIEMIHTYSLIHDDLPALDNDDLRRNQPTCHKKFGEDIAILAGDALATLAFEVIGDFYQDQPKQGLNLVTILSKHIGLFGMVLGQVIDLESKKQRLNLDSVLMMHKLKTGALIRATLLGVAEILDFNQEKKSKSGDLGDLLGLAFQLRDDLLDSKEKLEPGSIPFLVGMEKTQLLLNEIHEETLKLIAYFKIPLDSLFYQLVEFNLNRKT